jgi:hypothetical protein
MVESCWRCANDLPVLLLGWWQLLGQHLQCWLTLPSGDGELQLLCC